MILENLKNNLDNGAIYKLGDIFITQQNKYMLEYALLKQSFVFIFYFLIARYIFWLVIWFIDKTNRKRIFIKIFKKKVDILKWFYDLCLIVIEFRLIALIQIIYL